MNKETSPVGNSASPVTGDGVASAYIAAELAKARKDLKRTRVTGLVMVGIVGTYITFISTTLVGFFQPRQAAQVASGILLQHVNTDGAGLTAQVEHQIPLVIRQLPDYAIAELPRYRKELEANLESELRDHCQALSKDLGTQVDALIDQHHDEIKELLAHADDRAALRKALPDMDQTINNWLATDPDGRTIHRRITDLAAELREVEAQMGKLAANKNLTPEEQKARRTIAVLAKAIKVKDQESDPSAKPAVPSRKLASM